jgi:hypothetical protein
VRICFVGKYPPIQGGISAQSYWAIRGLAVRGHKVCVVTNAAEVEDGYRLLLEERDAEYLAPVFPDTGGVVRVFQPERHGALRGGAAGPARVRGGRATPVPTRGGRAAGGFGRRVRRPGE